MSGTDGKGGKGLARCPEKQLCLFLKVHAGHSGTAASVSQLKQLEKISPSNGKVGGNFLLVLNNSRIN